jgi:hypothetical protein
MPCHAMHPMQDLFLESFSYELQFDMHSYLHKIFILAKSGCYNSSPLVLEVYVEIYLNRTSRISHPTSQQEE